MSACWLRLHCLEAGAGPAEAAGTPITPPMPPRCDLCRAAVLGIHANPVRALPLFLVYLSTLFHTYSLATRHTASQASPEAGGGGGNMEAEAGAARGDLESGAPPSGEEGAARRTRLRRMSSGSGQRYLGESLGSSISGSLQHVGIGLLQACYAGERGCNCCALPALPWILGMSRAHGPASASPTPAPSCPVAWEFILRSVMVSERPPHHLLVTVPAPVAAADGEGGPVAAVGQQWGLDLQAQLHRVLDSYRRTDIAAAREQQEQVGSAG